MSQRSARILEIDGSELIGRFKDRKEVAVIPGFQGINPQTGRITTLGRGGSDTSAVAIAAAIQAERCDIYTDVDGVYTTDPRIEQKARRLAKVSVIGIGMRSHAGVAAQAFKALAERQINIRAITTSEIKFSLLIDANYTELAVRTLHSLYELDK